MYFTSYSRLFKYMVSFPRYFTVYITYQPPLVYMGFVMCGCFGNMCTCIYCVFVLFCLCIFILVMVLFNFLSYVFCYVYVILLCMFCFVYYVFIVPTSTLRLPWLRFFHAFFQGITSKDGARPALFPNCVVLCIVCV